MKRDQQHRFNPVNERVKYKYRLHMRRRLKKDEKTTIAALKHLRDFELFIEFAGFEKFCDAVADKYITRMMEQGLSMHYINDNIRALKEFLRWLERQRGYKSKIDYNHIDSLNISDNQRRAAKSTAYKKSYTYPQIVATIRNMPDATIIQKRNKAIISLQALCGLRISELRTVKLRNLIEENGQYFIHVNPKDMIVKFAKTRYADFVALPDDILRNVLVWRDYLRSQDFKDKEPFFPQITRHFNQGNLLESTITRHEIRSNTTIRDVFKKAFETAGYEYLRPHSFRHTIARNAEKHSPEYLNAVRQSLGHSSIDTTFQSYGDISVMEQRNRIAKARFDF